MARDKFDQEEQKRIIDAVAQAELSTSGEVRVHIESRCKDANVLDRASQVFAHLDMQKTKARNGVLIYVALDDHQFAIIGDVGINQKVPEDFWDATANEMTARFKEGQVLEGIITGIRNAGEQLAAYFPYTDDDINELSDEISFGE
jgi:uncharacterized membrane protein